MPVRRDIDASVGITTRNIPQINHAIIDPSHMMVLTGCGGRRIVSHTTAARAPPPRGPAQNTLEAQHGDGDKKSGGRGGSRVRDEGCGLLGIRFRSCRSSACLGVTHYQMCSLPTVECSVYEDIEYDQGSIAVSHQWLSQLLLVTEVPKVRAGLIEHPSTGINTKWAGIRIKAWCAERKGGAGREGVE